MTKKNIFFYSILIIFLFVLSNILSFITIKIITDKYLYTNDYIEFKKRFRKSGSKSTYPHPFFGHGVKDNLSLPKLLNDEPLLANDSIKYINNNKTNILILGGSVAKHLSNNSSGDVIKYKNVSIDNKDIFKKTINEYFETDKFEIYNAAIDGGKQPQQLFKLYYLDLIGLEFDIIINLDGFNELALTLSENYAINDHLIYPRNYSRLISTFNSSFNCVSDINIKANRFSYIPIIEFYDLYKIRNCHFSLEGANKNSGTRFSEITNYNKTTFDKALKNSIKIWNISSNKINDFSLKNNTTYLHILQPNLYLKNSKKLTSEELNLLNYPKYGNIISKYYKTLNLNNLKTQKKLDLRYVFEENTKNLYRDYCCHLNNLGMHLISLEIIKNFDNEFNYYLN